MSLRLIACAASLLCAPHLFGAAPDIDALNRRAMKAFEDHDYDDARDALEHVLEADDTAWQTHYNLACALSMLGRTDEAMQRVLDAMKYGFVDFHHLQRDPHLAPLHGQRTYEAVIGNWPRLLDARAEAEFDALHEWLGAAYDYQRDPRRRLNFASAFEEAETHDALRQIDLVERWGYDGLIPPPADEARPHPWVTVILPTTEDFRRLVGVTRVGGIYDKDAKRLVTQDIGPSLRHEYFHVMHWRHMAEVGQEHAYWVMEGLASLVEDVDEDGDRLVLRPSWRTNIARRLERAGALTPWPVLFAMDRDRFVGRRPRANYAQARAVMLFLDSQGLLGPWYDRYVRTFAEDPTGLEAMRETFDAPISDIERRYESWLEALEEVGEQRDPGDASLGVPMGAGAGDGPAVEGVAAGTSGARANRAGQRLRRRDVILAIDARPVRTLDDLYRILGEYAPGQTVHLDVRRGTRRLDFDYVLVEQEDTSLPQ